MALKFLQQLPKSFFLGVAMELLIGEEMISLNHTRIMAQKGFNFFLRPLDHA
jgi:hypothetical protein